MLYWQMVSLIIAGVLAVANLLLQFTADEKRRGVFGRWTLALTIVSSLLALTVFIFESNQAEQRNQRQQAEFEELLHGIDSQLAYSQAMLFEMSRDL